MRRQWLHAAPRELCGYRRGLAVVSGFRPYRFTAEVYHRLVESGAFGDKSSMFLLKGQLVEKVSDMTKGRKHVFAHNRIGRILSRVIPDGYFVEQEQPVDLGKDSVPEPDLKVVRGDDEDYLERDPVAGEVPIVVEVADSSLPDDSGEMLRIYAAALIPVYWIVNIPNRRIDVYSRPISRSELSRYEEWQSFGIGDMVPVMIEGVEVGKIAVKDVLPRS